MKSKGFGWLWIIGIPLLIVLVAWSPAGGNLLLTLALPFTIAGRILRQLSLSGEVGNVAAIGLYIMVCVSPLLLVRKKDGWKRNGLLLLECLALFWVMWYMVNPNQMPLPLRNEVGMAIYAGAVYSVMITWGVNKLLAGADRMIQKEIYTALQVILLVCAVICLLDGVGLGFSAYRAGLDRVSAGNTALTDRQLFPTYLFLTLEFCLGMVEHLLVAWILGLGMKLLGKLEEDPYSESCEKMSEGIFALCRKAIPLILGTNMILNLGQVFFAGLLVNVDVTLRIPVVSLGLTFAMMALTRLLGEGKALKDDNDLFI